MVELIWAHGENWDTKEYNKRLSKENKLILQHENEQKELDKKQGAEQDELDERQEQEINEVWVKKR